MDHITIKGHQFEIPSRYMEGHELTAGEARKLQREYAKVLDVWTRKKLKTAESVEDVQSELDAYASQYAFGVRAGSGPRKLDPIAKKAFELAQRDVREKLKRAGAKLKDVKIGLINGRARQWANDPSRGYLELAKKELRKGKPQQLIDDDVADLLGL